LRNVVDLIAAKLRRSVADAIALLSIQTVRLLSRFSKTLLISLLWFWTSP